MWTTSKRQLWIMWVNVVETRKDKGYSDIIIVHNPVDIVDNSGDNLGECCG